MSSSYKTPDVYVKEISVFPPSVAEVGTAIPAFIGLTKKVPARVPKDSVVPIRINSIAEFEELFGGAAEPKITVTITEATASAPRSAKAAVAGTTTMKLGGKEQDGPPKHFLYWAVRMFFDNGGSQCYVASVGNYEHNVTIARLKKGLDAIRLEDEPTLLVAPEAVTLKVSDYAEWAVAALKQCFELQDRFAVFDLHPDEEKPGAVGADGAAGPATAISFADRRGAFGTEGLKYGAVYHPLLRTNFNPFVNDDEDNVTVGDKTLKALSTSNTTDYNFAKAALRDVYLILPPSGAVVGAYARIDAARGVWKAPANTSLAGVIEPMVRIDNLAQGELNVDPTSGKSINAIRAFAGRGTLIWGARTLAGNDNEWRYVNVRRFFNMAEESIKKSTYWAVFEPNDANTWVKVRGMIESYLTDKWRDGALAGATPKEAFFVRCGLGTTMSPQDILQGVLNVEIGMAVVRPAEFVVLKFSHKLQTS